MALYNAGPGRGPSGRFQAGETPAFDQEVFRNQTAGTLMCWYRIEAFNLINTTSPVINDLTRFSRGTDNSARLHICMRTNDAGATYYPAVFARRLDSDAALSRPGVPNNNPIDGLWHHVAAVAHWDDQLIELYVDGVFNGSTVVPSWTGATSDTPGQGYVGYIGTINNQCAPGTAHADIRAYRRALNAGEISSIYHARGADRVRNGLYHRWPLSGAETDDGFSGGVTFDQGEGRRILGPLFPGPESNLSSPFNHFGLRGR